MECGVTMHGLAVKKHGPVMRGAYASEKKGAQKEAGRHINVTLSRTENQGDVEYTLQLLLESSHSTRLLEK